MSVEFDRGSPGKFDSRTLNREPLSKWSGRMPESDPLKSRILARRLAVRVIRGERIGELGGATRADSYLRGVRYLSFAVFSIPVLSLCIT